MMIDVPYIHMPNVEGPCAKIRATPKTEKSFLSWHVESLLY